MSEKKSINKSIRLSPKVYNYIDSYPGNGFNEKFENIILEAMEFEDERKQRLEYLDERINMKLEQISVLEDKIKSLNEFLLVAVRANGMFKQLEELRNKIVSQK